MKRKPRPWRPSTATSWAPKTSSSSLQDNGLEDQKTCLAASIRIAEKLGLGMVATNDIHYPRMEDADAHELLLCINTGKTMQDQQRMRLGSREFYFKSPDEMIERFGKIAGAIDNTVAIAERCDVKLDFKTRNFPKFPLPKKKTASAMLRELCETGLQARYDGKPSQDVLDRVDHELGVIKHMGYDHYFLIVWDMVNHAREMGVPNGLRGSGASSMVCYLLGISDIDPLQHNLIFERFLDAARREPPDLDIDLCEHGREAVMEYVKEKYGHQSTAQIITFGTMAARGVIRDVGRALGWAVADVDKLAKRIPGGPGVTLKKSLEEDGDLASDYQNDPQIRQLLGYALQLEGMARHASTHAAGVVVADKPLYQFIPICQLKDVVMSQFAMGDLEKSGMLKLDLLGLRTLTIVNKTLELIEQRTGKKPDLNAIALDDAKTFELLCRGDTNAVFQLGSTGMQELLRRLQPGSIADIVAVVAMYRPGPLQSGMVDDFIARRHGEKEIEYLDPRLEPMLKDTYGVIVYQEQIMRILNELGGLTLADSLTTIKAISKKKLKLIEKREAEFKEGAQKSGLSKKVVDDLFELISNFAQYGFNRAHATAYAFLAYRTAYLKANFPMEFTAAGLTCEMNYSDKLKEHIRDSRQQMKIKILPPCVNEGDGHFTVCDGQGIRFGMVGVRNVGARAVEAVVAARTQGEPFKSLYEFCERVDLTAVNRQCIESLVKAGAFDCLPGHRAQKVAALESALKMGQRAQEDSKRGQKGLFDFGEEAKADYEQELPWVEEWSLSEMGRFEKEALGMRLSFNPLDRYEEMIKQLSTATAETLAELEHGMPVFVAGEVISVRPIMTKNGRSMAMLEIEDESGTIRAVMFPDCWQEYGNLVREDAILFLGGTVDKSNDRLGIIVTEVVGIDEAREKLTQSVRLRLQRSGLDTRVLDDLYGLCERHAGRCPVLLEIRMPDDRAVLIRAGRDVTIRPSDAFDAEVNSLLGGGHICLVGRPPVAEERGNGRRRFNRN